MISSTDIPLFDFAAQYPHREQLLTWLHEFAACDAFRSASVHELELDDDFYRRPLRPEDFSFLKYQKPVRFENVSRLPSLATNRTLLIINELDVARVPGCDADEQRRCDTFYADRPRILGAQMRPYLEAYAFDYLCQDVLMAENEANLRARLENGLNAEMHFWESNFAKLQSRDFLTEGLRFSTIQRWGTLSSRRTALARASAACYLDWLDPRVRPNLDSIALDDAVLTRVAEMSGVTRRTHSYWQFYLPTTLAKCNLLYALGARPDRAFAFAGAAFVAEAEHLTYTAAMLNACPHVAAATASRPPSFEVLRDRLITRFTRTIDALKDQHGDRAVRQFTQGFAAAERLGERGRWDLGEQLNWLSSIDLHCQWARQIYDKIERDYPTIDRDTFVEPHELCSTTHVHNENRLVVIESGDMLFWGNLGMRLSMHPGDMVLIPDGRLHGSTVVSDSCTYHQPIIPDEWIAEFAAPQAATATATANV